MAGAKRDPNATAGKIEGDDILRCYTPPLPTNEREWSEWAKDGRGFIRYRLMTVDEVLAEFPGVPIPG